MAEKYRQKLREKEENRNNMKVTAKLNHLRISSRKVRRVADLIRGLDVENARHQLRFMGQRSTLSLHKLLESAIANAKNQGLVSSNLYVYAVLVDGGPILKRHRPRMGGRASPLRKRTSHVTLVLEEREPSRKTRVRKAKKIRTGASVATPRAGEQQKEEEVRDDTRRETPGKPKKLRAPKEEGGFRKTSSFVKKVFRRKSI